MYKIIHKMYNLLNKGKEKILECFYRNRKELYFSEILRETKLTPNTTLKHLNNLKDLIISTKTKGNTFYKIDNKNLQVFSVFSYFDYKRFNELDNIRKRAISEFIENLNVKPLIILIFGSTAKKTYTKKSDIDILLIYNKKEEEDKKLKKDIEATTGLNIQTFIIDYDYFKEQLLKKEDNLIIHAIKTGFVITGGYYFYKEILR
ncbi:nucleotidyltransferase domain-containing protein [Candidatus Woesearchaeota archaeon]|nr:nucleotidyltransferase domain-containing protein [Candidatus Woesearchaeota archaeon]